MAMTVDELAVHFNVPKSELRLAHSMLLEALRYAARHSVKIRRVGKCWEVCDPINHGNVVKFADSWLTKGEISRLRQRN